ncbi:MFS transporter [Actinoplanes sp. RD1]|uniref:MFS transporter n=1 Tax=Actinoplanes sp. RD1 TaxID=3064538 RepID=UPI002740C4D5|nr:MFS transporter [Actinoplanes sp. RD1]
MTTQRRATRSTAVVTVALAYALQGLGYAVIVTALPSFKDRTGIGDTTVSAVLLGVCVTAALGSLLADLVAVRRSSRHGVLLGFAVQAVALVVVAFAPGLALFVAAVLAYGLGLGVVDAASNMQGVLVQRGLETPLLGRFYAAYTTATIAGALAMSGAIATGGGATVALLLAAGAQLVLVALAGARLDPSRAAHAAHDEPADRTPLNRRAIVVVGLVVLAAFTVDSAVSSWSTVHLDGLGAAAALAPLGYVAYQGGVLLARLATDRLVRRSGPATVMSAALVAGVLGGLVVAFVPGPGAAIAGFTLSGLAVGALVPIAFGLAGRIEPGRSDEVVARVNLFNYAGAVLGAVGVGLVIGTPLAFLLPVVLLATAIPALRTVRR